MITNYSQPRDTVELIKQNATPATTFAARAIAIGTQFALARYGQESPTGIDYDSSALLSNPIDLTITQDDIVYAMSARADLALDLSSAKLYAENILLINGDFSTVSDLANAFFLASLSTPNKIRHSHPTNNLAGGTLLTELQGRAVQVGDTILVDDNVGGNGYVERTVTALLGRVVARHVGSNTNQDNGNFATGAFNPPTTSATATKISGSFVDSDFSLSSLTLSGSFGSAGTARAAGALESGDFAEIYTVTFTGAPSGTGVAPVTVTSASGKFTASFNTTNNSGAYRVTHACLNGLIIDLASNVTPASGDVFVVRGRGAYTNAGTWATLRNITLAAGFTGTVPTTFVIRVKQGAELAASAHIFQVSDTAGTFTPFEVTRSTLASGASLGVVSGLDLGVGTPSTVGFRTGDTFYLSAVPDTVSTTEFDGVVLSGPAADTTLFIDVADPLPVLHGFKKSGLVGEDWAVTGLPYEFDADANTVELLAALRFTNGSTLLTARNGFGQIFPSFRAAVIPELDETAIVISSEADLAQFGPDDSDNELGKAVASMYSGALGLEVSALRVGSAAAADYTTRFRKLQSDDVHYAHSPQAVDADVRLAARTHVESMSVKTKKHFRRAYVGVNSPGRRAVLKLQPDTTPYTATVSDYGGEYRLVTFSQVVDLQALNVRAGDEFYFPVDDVTSVIAQVLSATEALIETGLSTALSPAVPIQLWKPGSARNTMDFIIDAAKAIDSDRVCLVWCEGGRRGLEAAESQFIAAEIAGLRTAVLPQVGLSGVQLRTVTSATPMYARYTEDELNEVASYGVMIVMQDGPGAPVYIRHQLTTKTDNGILSWEDSCGYNHDMVGFAIKAVIKGYRGQTNRTETTRLRLESDVFQCAVDLGQAPVGQEAGPQIVDFLDENGVAGKVTVRFDKTFADRFYVFADFGLPVPVNGTDAKIRAHVQEVVN